MRRSCCLRCASSYVSPPSLPASSATGELLGAAADSLGGLRTALADALRRAIRKTAQRMLAPVPIVGVRGMRMLARRLERLPVKEAASLDFVGHMVRMQEEIGTGGGGFRYMYGAFLQEAYAYFGNDALVKLSDEFTRAGDLWRTAAVQASGIYKGRLGSQEDFDIMGDYLVEISQIEKQAFHQLSNVMKHLS